MLLQLQPTPGQGFIPLNIGEHLIDQRLGELGWCRHPLQPRTPADGSCGLWGIAAHVSDSQQPGAEDRGVRGVWLRSDRARDRARLGARVGPGLSMSSRA